VRYLLLFLSAIPAWCGSITIPFNPTISCIVTTVPPNPIVTNDCSSTPGISSNIGSSGVGIVVNWGPNNFNLAVSSGFSILLRESLADLNLAVTGSIMGHVEYSQDFILTGGPGLALVGGFQGCDSSDGGAPVFTNLSVGGIAPGVFHVFASADLNWTLTLPPNSGDISFDGPRRLAGEPAHKLRCRARRPTASFPRTGNVAIDRGWIVGLRAGQKKTVLHVRYTQVRLCRGNRAVCIIEQPSRKLVERGQGLRDRLRHDFPLDLPGYRVLS
jgi:hypothetical protein